LGAWNGTLNHHRSPLPTGPRGTAKDRGPPPAAQGGSARAVPEQPGDARLHLAASKGRRLAGHRHRAQCARTRGLALAAREAGRFL